MLPVVLSICASGWPPNQPYSWAIGLAVAVVSFDSASVGSRMRSFWQSGQEPRAGFHYTGVHAMSREDLARMRTLLLTTTALMALLSPAMAGPEGGTVVEWRVPLTSH